MLKVKRTSLPNDLDECLMKRQAKANSSIKPPDEIWKLFRKDRKYKKFQTHLRQVFNGKCAYCEDNAGTDIEHFWPKSPHEDNQHNGCSSRMFEWENLFSSCDYCNTLKGAKMGWNADGQPKLLNPCLEDPYKFFNISIDGWISPRLEMSASDIEKANYTIELFELNLRSTSLKRRKNNIQIFLNALKLLNEFEAKHESESIPGRGSLEQIFLALMEVSQPCLAPIRHILIDNPELHQSLLQKIPELDQMLEKWFLPLEP